MWRYLSASVCKKFKTETLGSAEIGLVESSQRWLATRSVILYNYYLNWLLYPIVTYSDKFQLVLANKPAQF